VIKIKFLLFSFLKQSSATCRFFTGSKAHVFPSLKPLKCLPKMCGRNHKGLEMEERWPRERVRKEGGMFLLVKMGKVNFLFIFKQRKLTLEQAPGKYIKRGKQDTKK